MGRATEWTLGCGVLTLCRALNRVRCSWIGMGYIDRLLFSSVVYYDIYGMGVSNKPQVGGGVVLMKAARCRPNLFIVGAPKSGTSSLYHYLWQHPDVLMSSAKEPCYLAPDFFCDRYPKSEAEYLKLFDDYSGELVVGEATSTYLYSKLAAKRIKQYAPDAKIIAMLRNPAEMVPSLHAQRLKEGWEYIRDLAMAMKAEDERRHGKRIPKGFNFPKEYLLYSEFPKYCEQLSRYYSEFDRDKVHIIIFDDFVCRPDIEFVKVCRFLGISEKFKPEFTEENQASLPKYVPIHRALVLTMPYLSKIKELMEKIAPRFLVRVFALPFRLLSRANMTEGRVAVAPDMEAFLNNYYSEEINNLGKLLKRDLSFWNANN